MLNENKAIVFKDLRSSGGGSEIPFVAFHETQELDDIQKAQALDNIDGDKKKKVVLQTESNVTINPNVLNKWETSISSLTFSLATPVDSGIVNEYMIEFTSPSTATTLSYPISIVWAESNATREEGGVFVPNIEANKTYQISIVNNNGIIGGF